ncbi:MAG: helicase HerA-like C-terminal domain-containing protein [Gammaproteobacteria bacterium]
MQQPWLIAKAGDTDLYLLPQMSNRHGLITGATGTGKTVSLQAMAQQFSRGGVPVFLADIKGDLSGMAKPGTPTPKVKERFDRLKIIDPGFSACPVTFWDLFAEQGHPVRATVSDMGPLLLSRILKLNETQEGVLTLIFRIADDNGFLLLDLKDLRAMVQHVGENAKDFTTEYGNVSSASVGTIQRGLLALEEQGGDKFFGEPMLDIKDLMQTDSQGRGVINILAADRLMESPKLYATLLLWMLAELFENLPEVGDAGKPRMVFFFDEAHLLFNAAPNALLEKIEQVVRLIRSKGVGIFFVTQNPLDVPDPVLAQLGNRVQHALRAFTARDQKAVKTAAETLRQNPKFNAEEVITELGVGEALVSFLDEQGRPNIAERALIIPPGSQIGPITRAERESIVEKAVVQDHYEKSIDRESAYEILKARAAKREQTTEGRESGETNGSLLNDVLGGLLGERARRRRSDGIGESMAKSAARAVGTQLGRQLIRGVLGSLIGRR